MAEPIINQPIQSEERPPTLSVGPLGWARQNLFNTWYNTVFTVLAIWVLWQIIPPIIDWMFIDALWGAAPSDACRVEGVGACWPFVHEKWRLIVFGLYPYDEQWRPTIAMIIAITLLIVSCTPKFWPYWRWLIAGWIVAWFVILMLMQGGVFGLEVVYTSRWGGLPLTVGLSVIGLVLAFPLSILLALGRRSNMPAIKTICVAYIELIRGVPLITVLFMASLLFPLFMPVGTDIDNLLRAQIGLILFASAYLAEVVRGGLQAIPKGQYEAADSLGLSYWKKTRLIVLPQALRISIPPLVNTFIGFFKDTSLVIIIGLFDLLGAAKAALTDPEWRGFYKEAYIFTALLYFIFCFSMSRYSQHLEKRTNVGTRR